MLCKHCHRKVFTLHDGYCGPCRRNLAAPEPTENPNSALDNLAEQTLQITLQVSAEKDQIIRELRQKLANCTCL